MRNYRVLYVCADGRELTYRSGILFFDMEKVITLLDSWKKRLLSRIRLINRLLRLEPRCATFLNNDVCLVAFNHFIYVISLKERKMIEKIPRKKNLLSFCSMKPNGEEAVYWGDYGRETVDGMINVNKYTLKDGHQVVYSYKFGDIKHIHSVLFDRYNNNFYVLTGDFESKIGIYTATRDFSKVTPLAIGEQKYRAVVGLPLPNGLLYATDAVMEENFIYFFDAEKKELRKIESINGSVIYGVAVNNGLLLSTTVEPYPSGASRIKSMLDTRLGLGIKSKDVHVLFISSDLNVTQVASYRKDWHFMKLMQYGQVFFPEYEDSTACHIKANPMAVKGYDGKLVEFNLSK